MSDECKRHKPLSEKGKQYIRRHIEAWNPLNIEDEPRELANEINREVRKRIQEACADGKTLSEEERRKIFEDIYSKFGV